MKDSDTGPAGNSARIAREKRLAEALRANLRRRKAAGRATGSTSDADGGDPAPEKPRDSTEKRE